MRIVTPSAINTADLLASNVVNDYSNWSPGTYNAGDTVVDGESVYEALGTTTDQPAVGAAATSPTWVRLGYSNVWRMFRDSQDSRTTQPDQIVVTIQTTGFINAVALLGLVGVSAQAVMTDAVDGVVYDETISLVDIGVDDWWEYFFTDYETVDYIYISDLPQYGNAQITITITAASALSIAECGRVVIGSESIIGVTTEGAQSRIEDFSRKERDAFGNLVLVPRRTVRVIDFDVMVEHTAVYSVGRKFAKLAATPILYIGHPDMPETIVFGVYESFSTILNGHTITECSLSVEEF